MGELKLRKKKTGGDKVGKKHRGKKGRGNKDMQKQNKNQRKYEREGMYKGDREKHYIKLEATGPSQLRVAGGTGWWHGVARLCQPVTTFLLL